MQLARLMARGVDERVHGLHGWLDDLRSRLLNLQAGRDFADSLRAGAYTNTRGFIGSGTIGDRFYFETLLAENQSVFPGCISDQTRISKVVPGQGGWKTFKKTGYDYAFSSGFF